MKRLKKILQWTAIVLGGLVAIGLVANACFVWITDTRLERQLAEIRAAGDPISLTDLARKPIPPEKNAATFLRQAEAGVDAMHNIVFGPDISWIKRWEEKHLMPPEGLKCVKKAMDAYPRVIPLLQQAAACPDYDPQLDYGLPPFEFVAKLLPSVQALRGFVRVLEWRGHLLISEGKRDEAVRTQLQLLRLADHFNRNPTFVAYVVAITARGIAIELLNLILQSGPVSKQVRDALDADLALQERLKDYTPVMKGDLAFQLDAFRTLPGRNFWLVSRAVWNRRESECLDDSRALPTPTGDSTGYRQATQAVEKMLQGRPRSMPGDTLADELASPHYYLFARYMVNRCVFQNRAMIRSLRVLNALQSHAPAGSNEVPKLSSLGLPRETTTDPFTGEPLHVKRLPRGWLVYSVGWDCRDDGGKVDNPVNGDIGVGPPSSVTKPAENNR